MTTNFVICTIKIIHKNVTMCQVAFSHCVFLEATTMTKQKHLQTMGCTWKEHLSTGACWRHGVVQRKWWKLYRIIKLRFRFLEEGLVFSCVYFNPLHSMDQWQFSNQEMTRQQVWSCFRSLQNTDLTPMFLWSNDLWGRKCDFFSCIESMQVDLTQ